MQVFFDPVKDVNIVLRNTNMKIDQIMYVMCVCVYLSSPFRVDVRYLRKLCFGAHFPGPVAREDLSVSHSINLLFSVVAFC